MICLSQIIQNVKVVLFPKLGNKTTIASKIIKDYCDQVLQELIGALEEKPR